MKCINILKNNKAAGLDDMLCEQISNGMAKRDDEQHPCAKEVSKVIALLKPGKDSSLPKSYRPISLLCHTYKFLERMIVNRLNPITEHNIIKEQAAFRAGKSCTCQLLNQTQYIEDVYEKSLTTGTVFVDLLRMIL